MGLKLTLSKYDNHMGYDFIDAYWSIDNIEYGNYNGESYVSFNLNAYPSRESKYLNGSQLNNNQIIYGGPKEGYYNSILHTWIVQMTASELFPDGIPIRECDQKDILYEYVKSYTKLPFEDVFEENQNS